MSTKGDYATDKFSAHGYHEIYGPLFAEKRAHPIRLLELGVCMGESLRLWRDYFAPGSVIVGLDRDIMRPELKGMYQYVGDQTDRKVLDHVCAVHGPFDIIIDDASHIGAKTTASFEALLPHLAVGGIYAVEDLAGEGRMGQPRFVKLALELVEMVAHGQTQRWERIIVSPELVVFVKARQAVCE